MVFKVEEVVGVNKLAGYRPLVRRLPADFETPSSVYLKLAGEKPSFLLESVSGGEQLARYSFIGVDIDEAFVIRDAGVEHHRGEERRRYELTAGEGLFAHLRAFMAGRRTLAAPRLPRLSGGLVGYLGYGAVRYLEPSVRLKGDGELPDAIYLVADTVIAFDHAFGEIVLVTNIPMDDPKQLAEEEGNNLLDDLTVRLRRPLIHSVECNTSSAELPFFSNFERSEFEQAVLDVKEHIAAGDIFQAVVSQKLQRQTAAPPFEIYRSLRRLNPSPYMFFFNFSTLSTSASLNVIGASPEMHARLEGRRAAVRPIAGTRQRGESEETDLALETELLGDEKERAEHVMLVDLGRNDLGRVSDYGTVAVDELMVVERYSHVMHIVSQVEGQLADGYDAFELLASTFPAGTVSGAPKIRAMQIIDSVEREPRGLYAGVIGYFSYDGSMDSCIAIRTLVMEGNRVAVQAGAGVVADSIPEAEYLESLSKARVLAEAVALAERGS